MEPNNEQDEVLERLQTERSAWFAKLGVASTMDAEAPGFWGEHSLRDLIAHINFWQAYKNQRLQAGAAGEMAPEPWPADMNAIEDEDEQVDAINAFALEQAAGNRLRI